MTDQERKNRALRIRDKRLKDLEKQNKDLEKRHSELENIQSQYPPLIATMLKRLKRIDPWNSVAGMSSIDCSFVTYFKLRQSLKLDNDNLRIVVNPSHSWTEFKYDDKWWIFDPIAVKKLDLGYPIKLKNHADKEEYTKLSKYYLNIDDFIKDYNEKLSLDKDEAKIKAMEDKDLSSVVKLKYY